MKTPFLLLFAALIAPTTAAQTPSADEYFNRAARHYVKDDKLTALRTLDAGLRQYPGDARMLKLAEELLKENQQQQQQQQQQEQQQRQEQEQQEEQPDEQEQQQAGEKDAEEREAEQQERQQRSGEMTKEEAERMLDALEHKEQDVQQRVRTKLRPGRRASIDKDW